jgi:hypothetical protein
VGRARRHPEAWARITKRRAFLTDTLGIHLKPEVLPRPWSCTQLTITSAGHLQARRIFFPSARDFELYGEDEFFFSIAGE